MALGRIQTQIIDRLGEMQKLSADQKNAILLRPDEPTGDQLDRMPFTSRPSIRCTCT